MSLDSASAGRRDFRQVSYLFTNLLVFFAVLPFGIVPVRLHIVCHVSNFYLCRLSRKACFSVTMIIIVMLLLMVAFSSNKPVSRSLDKKRCSGGVCEFSHWLFACRGVGTRRTGSGGVMVKFHLEVSWPTKDFSTTKLGSRL